MLYQKLKNALPCPFCGSLDINFICVEPLTSKHPARWKVKCMICDAQKEVCTSYPHKQLTAEWNQRRPPKKIRKEKP